MLFYVLGKQRHNLFLNTHTHTHTHTQSSPHMMVHVLTDASYVVVEAKERPTAN